jgi:protein TonB
MKTNRSWFRGSLVVVLGAGLALALAFAQDGPQRVGGNVMAVKLVSAQKPVYPLEAKQNGIQGTVKLDVTVDKEGHVTELKLVSGPSALVDSAVSAVKQWVYSPTLLNGEPVTVLTTVDVNYSLAP